MNKPTLKEKFDETIEDMGIHSLYQEIIWQWIEQRIKEAKIDALIKARAQLSKEEYYSSEDYFVNIIKGLEE